MAFLIFKIYGNNSRVNIVFKYLRNSLNLDSIGLKIPTNVLLRKVY